MTLEKRSTSSSMSDTVPSLRKTAVVGEAYPKSLQEAKLRFTGSFQLTLTTSMEMAVMGGEISSALTSKVRMLIYRVKITRMGAASDHYTVANHTVSDPTLKLHRIMLCTQQTPTLTIGQVTSTYMMLSAKKAPFSSRLNTKRNLSSSKHGQTSRLKTRTIEQLGSVPA